MSLRLQLLVVALVVLLLPLAGWQSVRQMEGFLRSAQEQALIASARATAGALASGTDAATGTPERLYLRRAGYPPVLDGYVDEWGLWLPWAQPIGGPGSPAELVLARDDQYLYGLVRVTDDAIRYLDPRVGVSGADHIRLAVARDGIVTTFAVATGAPGELEVTPQEGAGALRLRGAWHEGADGYAVEWRLPVRGIEGLGIAVMDPRPGGPEPVAATGPREEPALPRSLAGLDPALSSRLSASLPDGSRGWIIDRHGWILGQGGTLEPVTAPVEASGRWWRSLVYRYLLAPPLAAPRARPDIAPRLDGSEVERALAGEAAVRWQPSPRENTVVASVAVPIAGPEGGTAGALVIEQPADALLVFTNDAVLRMVGLTLVAFGAAALALLGFASLLSMRIRRLRDAADRAVEPDGRVRGNFPVPRARDELGDLGRSFAALLQELRGHTEYLRTLADKLSHELRTPLAMVRSSLDNLEHEQLSELGSQYARRAREGAERLAQILRAMSEASRVEESIRHSEIEPFDPADLVTGQLAAWRDLHAGPRFEDDIPAQDFRVTGAPELVSRLLDKLLENAVDFTPEGGRIRVGVAPQPGGWRLSVVNEGPALPDDGAGRLFESMVSGRQGRDRGVHLGLGLYIARLIAEFHRGGIVARNLPDGVEFVAWFDDLRP